MRSSLPRLVAVAVSIVLWVGAASAQETTGKLEGRVLDSQGKPIPYVNVVVNGPSLQGTRGVLSTRQGLFVLLALPVGDYSVRVSHVAYQGRTIDDVHVGLGQTAALGDVRLEERQLTTQKVVVTARAPLIDPASTELGGTLVVKDIEALPIERDYRNVATLLPMATQNFIGDPGVNFAGSTGIENRFFVDGIDVTDPVRGATGTRLPYNFVQEVEVRTGGYEAEYRSALGGTVNAVTYSGGNEFTAQAFGFSTSDWFSAAPRSLPDSPNEGDFARYDVGVGIGGPIKRDKLWYSLAYNPTIERQDVEIPGQGMFEDKSTTHSFAAKLTWRANQQNTLLLTAVGDPTNRQGVGAHWSSFGTPVSFANPDPYLEAIRTGGVGFQFEGRHHLRDNLLIKTSLSRALHLDRNMPATERGAAELLFIDSLGVWSGGSADRIDNRGTLTAAAVTCTWWTGAHELKSGLEYKDGRYDFDVLIHGYYYVGQDSIGNPTYEYWYLAGSGRVANRVPSFFLQDSWRLRQGVRLNAGARWDGQYFISSEGKVAQSILDQLQPRIGFVWEPRRAGSDKVTGSYGRFYHDTACWPLFWYYNASTYWGSVRWDHDPRLDPAGADTLGAQGGAIQAKIDGMQGQYFDEFTLGYERQVGPDAKVGVRGIYRDLGRGLEDAVTPDGVFFDNPGYRSLSSFPKPKRSYSALEVSYQQKFQDRLSLLASYVLSRNHGDYPGLFNTDFPGGGAWPNANASYDALTIGNGEGLLPNDRPHALKLSGSYKVLTGLSVGTVITWQSGTPLNELGSSLDPNYLVFLQQRGMAGRTPSIWDLNLRVAYVPKLTARSWARPKLTLDVFHLGSPRRAVNYDQQHYRMSNAAGDQLDPNPFYLREIEWQPPMAIRLGAELSF